MDQIKSKNKLGYGIQLHTALLRVSICLIVTLMTMLFAGTRVWALSVQKNTNVKGVEVHFLDVGQGDCTLIRCKDEAMLIDGGDESRGYEIADYLKKQGVNYLKYYLITHPDADHCGGTDTVMLELDGTGLVIVDDSDVDKTSYREVRDMMNYLGIKTTPSEYGKRYTLGGASITLVSAQQHNGNTNDDSITAILDYGETSFIFMGDAEEAEESGMIKKGTNLKCDVIKIGHHGSKSSSSEQFISKVNPDYAVISCGEGNKYGHPHSATLNTLRSQGVKLFRTDEQGTIIATSDGKKITWNCSPSTSWQAGEPGTVRTEDGVSSDTDKAKSSEGAVSDTDKATSYVVNTNTKKFHYPSCSSVKEMKQKNRWDFVGSRQELIDKHYVPCKRCNP